MDWEIKCKACRNETAIYFCNTKECKCDNRILCQRCILRHSGQHSQDVLLLEDILGSEKGDGDELAKKLQEVSDKLAMEQEKFALKTKTLTERLDNVIEELLEGIREKLNAQKKTLLAAFTEDFESLVTIKHRQLSAQLNQYLSTQQRVKSSHDPSEIELMLIELSNIHVKYNTLENQPEMEAVTSFNNKWLPEINPADLSQLQKNVMTNLQGELQGFLKAIVSNELPYGVLQPKTPAQLFVDHQQHFLPQHQIAYQQYPDIYSTSNHKAINRSKPLEGQLHGFANQSQFCHSFVLPGNYPSQNYGDYYQYYGVFPHYPAENGNVNPAPHINGRISIFSSPPNHEKVLQKN